MHMYIHATYMPHTCHIHAGRHHTISGSQCSFSTMWVPDIKLNLLGMAASAILPTPKTVLLP
ncbi:mCG147917 [Mus musculus]|nr:mCG147917 [Mus musculus]